MAELKTRPSDLSVDSYLDSVADERRRQDCLSLVRLMRKATKSEPRMWGSSMVGFGSYHYKYASGHEGDAFLAGFASRKTGLTVYIMAGFEQHQALLAKLGKHKLGKSCLYIKCLSDVDRAVLAELVSLSVQHIKRKYG